MKKILITGANGLLGTNIIKMLASSGEFYTVAASRNKIEVKENNTCYISNESILSGDYKLKDIYAVINCAFARDNSPQALADGLLFTKNIFDCFKKNNLNNIINISSQGIYAQTGETEFIVENAPLGPKDAYGLTKIATECLIESIFNNGENCTNIRMASLNMPQRFTQYFINNALFGRPINVIGRDQRVSLMDVRDAASGIIALIKALPMQWRRAYNLGTGRCTTLGALATLTASLVSQECGIPAVDIEYTHKDPLPFAPVNITAICSDTNWKPCLSDADMLLEMIKNTLKI